MKSFIIKGRLPDLNTYIKAERTNKYIAAKMKSDWTTIAKLTAASKIAPIRVPVTISFTWFVKDKRRDKDNIMFGQKFILDGLVEAGILKNDGWDAIRQIHHAFTISKNKEEFVQINLLT